jgi:hypothetical protein
MRIISNTRSTTARARRSARAPPTARARFTARVRARSTARVRARSTGIYGSNPKKHEVNNIFAQLSASISGRVLYLESEECITTATLTAAGIPKTNLHAVTANKKDADVIAAREPTVRLSVEPVSETLDRMCDDASSENGGVSLNRQCDDASGGYSEMSLNRQCEGTSSDYCKVWLDYCGEAYGVTYKDGTECMPKLDIDRSLDLLLLNYHDVLHIAITNSTSRCNRGRWLNKCINMKRVNCADLAPKSSTSPDLPVSTLHHEFVTRSAKARNVVVTRVALREYSRAGRGGHHMTFSAFRISRA